MILTPKAVCKYCDGTGAGYRLPEASPEYSLPMHTRHPEVFRGKITRVNCPECQGRGFKFKVEFESEADAVMLLNDHKWCTHSGLLTAPLHGNNTDEEAAAVAYLCEEHGYDLD